MSNSKLISKVIEAIEGAGTGHEASPKLWVSTGNYALNKIISGDFNKGLPFGKVIEIFGDPSTGKSLLMSHLMAAVQKSGGIAVLDDTENAYNPFFGESIGINNDDLIRIKSKTVEEHIEKLFIGWEDKDGKKKKSIVQLLLKDNPELPIIICLDSLALLSTRHEQDTAFDTNDMSKAKLIKKGYRLASEFLEMHNVLYVVSNHVYTKIGVLYGNPKATPGGTGTPFQSSVRLDLVKGKKLKAKIVDESEEGAEPVEDKNAPDIGIETHVRVDKNRLAPPFRKATLEIYWDSGVSAESGLLGVLEDSKIISKVGKGVYGYGNKTFKPKEFLQFWEENKESIFKESSLEKNIDEKKEV